MELIGKIIGWAIVIIALLIVLAVLFCALMFLIVAIGCIFSKKARAKFAQEWQKSQEKARQKAAIKQEQKRLAQQESDNIQLYGHRLQYVCRQAIIKASDLQELKNLQQQKGLTDGQIQHFAKDAYRTAYELAISKMTLSPDARAGLHQLQLFLKIKPDTIKNETQELNHRARLYSIEQGFLPTTQSELMTKFAEVVHYSFIGDLLDERVAFRSMQGSSGSFGMRFGDFGVATTGSSGAILDHREMTVVDCGELVISNQRVVFLGELQSFEVYYQDLLSWTVCRNGLILRSAGISTKTLMIDNEFFDPIELYLALRHLIGRD